MDLGEPEGTSALRVPDHELAREILRRTGPMAVSSANLSGKPAALSADDAVDQLGDRVSVYLDGGAMSADRKSTRLNSSHANISYAVFCLKKKKIQTSLHPYHA